MKIRTRYPVKKILCFSTFLLIIYLQTSSLFSAPSARVKNVDGIPSLFVNEEPYPPYAYMSYLGEERYYREAATAGIHLYCFPAYLGDRGINSNSGIGPFRSAIWIGEEKYDFSSIIHDFRQILKADPQAMVIIRFHLDPPQWWDKQHPDACCLLPDGSTLRQSFFSDIWRQQAGAVLQKSIEWLLDSDYADHLIGIHVAAGFTEEWFYHFRNEFYNENPDRTIAFRQWLRQRYQNNHETLQQAWNNNSITLDTAEPADISGKNKRQEWRDPQQEQPIIDTFRFHTWTMADNIVYFCKIVKKSSQNRLLTGAFYGYHYFVTDPRRGHGALATLLDCPDLDYLSSPNVYNRVVGEDWPPMVAIQSVQQHGKLWLAENDTRTFKTTLLKDRAPDICPPGQYENNVWLGPPDVQTSVAFLWKNTARMLCYGYGGWWFDMWGGWFSDPALLDVLQKTQEFFFTYPSQQEKKMDAQVCVIVDEELQFYDASFGRLSGDILSNRYPLAKSGAPYDLYLRTDLPVISQDQYRVVWLLGILHPTANESRQLKKWLQQGITVLHTDSKGTRVYTPTKTDFYESKFKWPASELHQLWKKAGVFLYMDTNDVLYAGRGWLSIHSIKGGDRNIYLPFPAQVMDPLSQKIVADSTTSFKMNLAPVSTTLLRILPR